EATIIDTDYGERDHVSLHWAPSFCSSAPGARRPSIEAHGPSAAPTFRGPLPRTGTRRPARERVVRMELSPAVTGRHARPARTQRVRAGTSVSDAVRGAR